MKMLIIKHIKQIAFLAAILIVMFQSACKKDNEVSSSGTPKITKLRAVAPAPNDSTLTIAGPGNMVVIMGENFNGTKQIYFNGYPATFNSAIVSNTSIVVMIPPDMPFAKLDQANLNTVKVVTGSGEATFQFPIVPPPPVVTAMSNEYAKPGTKVTIWGNNFFYIDKVIFPGGVEATTGITSNDAGSMLTVTVPAGATAAGNIKVKNRYGTGTSVLLFNDFNTGVLHNYDNLNYFAWGAGKSNSSVTFPDNNGWYGVMNASGLSGGDMGWWNGNRSINVGPRVWVDPANFNQSLDSYAFKFEINVTKPWSAGSIYIAKDYSWTYIAVVAPWKGADGSVTPFVTNGWQTVTVPLSEFRAKANNMDGTGASAANLQGLLGATGAGTAHFMFVANGTDGVEQFEAAIDNIRVVKIK